MYITICDAILPSAKVTWGTGRSPCLIGINCQVSITLYKVRIRLLIRTLAILHHCTNYPPHQGNKKMNRMELLHPFLWLCQSLHPIRSHYMARNTTIIFPVQMPNQSLFFIGKSHEIPCQTMALVQLIPWFEWKTHLRRHTVEEIPCIINTTLIIEADIPLQSTPPSKTH